MCGGGGGVPTNFTIAKPRPDDIQATHILSHSPDFALSLLHVRGMINYQKFNRSEKHAKKARD